MSARKMTPKRTTRSTRTGRDQSLSAGQLRQIAGGRKTSKTTKKTKTKKKTKL